MVGLISLLLFTFTFACFAADKDIPRNYSIQQDAPIYVLNEYI